MTGLVLAPKISVLLSHWGGTVMSALTAQFIAPTKKVRPGATMGVVFLIGGILNAMMIPMPTWMVVTDVGLCPVSLVGCKGIAAPRESRLTAYETRVPICFER